MLHACHCCVPTPENPGAWLGAVLGEAALARRDKLTLVLPQAASTLGYWIEQLIAESTGKEGKGILPVEGEPRGPPDAYGDDRLFVAIGDHPGLSALEDAGHPVVRLPYSDQLQIGAEFFRWEFATAVAGFVNMFDPQVIVIGGGVAKAGDLLLEQARAIMESLAMSQPLKGVRLVVSELGDFAGALGMVARSVESEKERG